MAEIFITRRVFRDAIDILEQEGHTIDINDTDRILPARELVLRYHFSTSAMFLPSRCARICR